MSQQPNKNKHSGSKKKSKTMSNEKLQQKINKILGKVDKDNKKKEEILKINKVYGQKLQDLLNKVSNSKNDCDPELVNTLKQIQKDRKDELRKLKERVKESKRKQKQESKIKRDLKKIEKEEKKLQLESSRVEQLPELKDGLKFINIIVDGWNICGCDKIARKSMRGKRSNGAIRIIELMRLFRHCSSYVESNNTNNVNITIHFDGNGKDQNLENDKITVKYSGKKEIVDDRLVRELGANIKNISSFKINGDVKPYSVNNKDNPNRNYFVVTSDRELTIRLNKIGVTCIKSGTFYKTYLKPLAVDDVDENDENKNNNNTNNKDVDGDQNMVDKKKPKSNVWKKYVKNKTFSDDSSSSSSSSDSDF